MLRIGPLILLLSSLIMDPTTTKPAFFLCANNAGIRLQDIVVIHNGYNVWLSKHISKHSCLVLVGRLATTSTTLTSHHLRSCVSLSVVGEKQDKKNAGKGAFAMITYDPIGQRHRTCHIRHNTWQENMKILTCQTPGWGVVKRPRRNVAGSNLC